MRHEVEHDNHRIVIKGQRIYLDFSENEDEPVPTDDEPLKTDDRSDVARRLVSEEMRQLARTYERRGYKIACQHTRDGDWLTVEELGATLMAEQGGPVNIILHDAGHVATVSASDAPLVIDEYRDPATEIGPGPYRSTDD